VCRCLTNNTLVDRAVSCSLGTASSFQFQLSRPAVPASPRNVRMREWGRSLWRLCTDVCMYIHRHVCIIPYTWYLLTVTYQLSSRHSSHVVAPARLLATVQLTLWHQGLGRETYILPFLWKTPTSSHRPEHCPTSGGTRIPTTRIHHACGPAH
jgi:hypothetical protein